ncbi:MAG: glycosyltransferase [Candidatus Methylacidiphilales bacterium]|nr:glycosyltransferase [Candidatus Methylacidiphilales bacterium]
MIKRVLYFIRRTAAHFILKGKVMDVWLWRQTRRLAAEYSCFVLAASSRAKPVPCQARVSSVRSLKRILFLCANMWEKRELLPELRKLAEVDFMDVSPFILQGQVNADDRLDFEALRNSWKSSGERSYDVSVVYLNAALLNLDLLQEVRRKTDGLLLGLNLDDKTSYSEFTAFRTSPQNYRNWARHFDCNLSNSRSLVDIYNDDGHPCLYLPTGFHFNPEVHRFQPQGSFDYELSFVGSCKHERRKFVGALQDMGIEVKLFGGGWEGAEFTDEGPSVYRRSLINLGIGYNLPGSQFTNLKNRDFECPGSGGCYLTTFDWELADCFEVGKEILCYRDVHDFCEIFAYYRRRPELCRKIAEAGYLRAKDQHTWAHRFASVFVSLGFTINPLK